MNKLTECVKIVSLLLVGFVLGAWYNEGYVELGEGGIIKNAKVFNAPLRMSDSFAYIENSEFRAGLWYSTIVSVAQAETLSVSPPVVQAPSTTVAGLPTCSTALRGRVYVVTDSLLPAALATVAAGGAVVVSVFCNGTNWIVL